MAACDLLTSTALEAYLQQFVPILEKRKRLEESFGVKLLDRKSKSSTRPLRVKKGTFKARQESGKIFFSITDDKLRENNYRIPEQSTLLIRNGIVSVIHDHTIPTGMLAQMATRSCLDISMNDGRCIKGGSVTELVQRGTTTIRQMQ